MQFLGRRPRTVVDLALPYRNIRTLCNPLQQLFHRVSAAMMILGSLPGWNRSLVQPGCGRCWVTVGPGTHRGRACTTAWSTKAGPATRASQPDILLPHVSAGVLAAGLSPCGV